MLRNRLWICLAPVVLAGFLWSCGKDEPSNVVDEIGSSAPVRANGGEIGAAPLKREAPTGSSVAIPDELKHAAYEYYGLVNTESLELEMTAMGQSFTGGRVSRLVEVKDGRAIFEVEHTGGLAGQGTFTYSLEKTGLYAVGASTGKMTPSRQMELPADLSPGAKWPTKMTLETANGILKSDHSQKVVGPQRVKTKAGEFDALLLMGAGRSEMRGTKTNDTMKIWLVKGLGPVKMELVQQGGGATNKVSMEATKVPAP